MPDDTLPALPYRTLILNVILYGQPAQSPEPLHRTQCMQVIRNGLRYLSSNRSWQSTATPERTLQILRNGCTKADSPILLLSGLYRLLSDEALHRDDVPAVLKAAQQDAANIPEALIAPALARAVTATVCSSPTCTRSDLMHATRACMIAHSSTDCPPHRAVLHQGPGHGANGWAWCLQCCGRRSACRLSP